jgi:hypothetical protein
VFGRIPEHKPFRNETVDHTATSLVHFAEKELKHISGVFLVVVKNVAVVPYMVAAVQSRKYNTNQQYENRSRTY